MYEMMSMALGGIWGRLEDEEAETEAASDNNVAESDANAAEAVEAQVVETLEVRT